MPNIVLETGDGEFVYGVEIEEDPPVLILWNERFFVLEEATYASASVTYTEAEPYDLPYEMPQARPADDDTEGEGEDAPGKGPPYE
jgi:hypothetical protein